MPPPIENTAAASMPNARLAPAPPSGLSAMPPHPSHSVASHTVYSDRFIPSRSRSNLALFDLATPAVPSPYCELLSAALFWPATPIGWLEVGTPGSGNIFKFKAEAVPRRAKRALFGGGDEEEQLFAGISTARGARPRKIPRTPYKILDAPTMQDDFYRNLLDWSSQNALAVGLGNIIYLLDASRDKDDDVCSVGWAQPGTHLAVGTKQGKVQIWDVTRSKRIRTMESHRMRVGALAWGSSLLSSGSRDKSILHHDIHFPGYQDNQRIQTFAPLFRYNSKSLSPPTQESPYNLHAIYIIAPFLLVFFSIWIILRELRFTHVCGLKWSYDDRQLASGGNDKRIIMSSLGDSQNQIIVWRYPTMSKVVTLTGHTNRVLHSAISPDGQSIATCAGDETLQFWNVFPPLKSQRCVSLSVVGETSFVRSYIR
uniref:Anaphase-promoting complex subunit 4-like WD40 domain-containing protein n=2 Tax=Setaria italica TaxID=4555 RepID=K3YSP3_SETIT